MGCEDLVKYFYHMTLNIKLYHWSTHSYSRHKASDTLYGNLLELIDKFIEVYMGAYCRPKYDEKFNISVTQFNDTDIKNELENYKKYITNELPKYLKESDTDLLNIRDEILGELNQTLYLFTLK